VGLSRVCHRFTPFFKAEVGELAKKTDDKFHQTEAFSHTDMSKRSQLFLLPLSEGQPPRGALVFGLILFTLYSPFSWILLREGPWDERRLLLLKSWPTLPGFLVRSLVFLEGQPEWLSYSIMGLVTLLAFIVLWHLGRSSYFGLLLAFFVAALFSSWNSWMAFQAYLG